jgi:hypothetical protein
LKQLQCGLVEIGEEGSINPLAPDLNRRRAGIDLVEALTGAEVDGRASANNRIRSKQAHVLGHALDLEDQAEPGI